MAKATAAPAIIPFLFSLRNLIAWASFFFATLSSECCGTGCSWVDGCFTVVLPEKMNFWKSYYLQGSTAMHLLQSLTVPSRWLIPFAPYSIRLQKPLCESIPESYALFLLVEIRRLLIDSGHLEHEFSEMNAYRAYQVSEQGETE
jgi:hypothetical protein